MNANEFIIRHIREEKDVYKLISIMEVLGIKETYFKRENCTHKWKYCSGSPMNETHECTKCGAVG